MSQNAQDIRRPTSEKERNRRQAFKLHELRNQGGAISCGTRLDLSADSSEIMLRY